MLISLHFNFEGIHGPGGLVGVSMAEVLATAIPLAAEALDQMGDLVSELQWFDTSGNETNPRDLLRSNDHDQVQDLISQISDTMKSHGFGNIDIHTHDDFFDLIAHHGALDWASDGFKRRYCELSRSYIDLVSDFSDEWSSA